LELEPLLIISVKTDDSSVTSAKLVCSQKQLLFQIQAFTTAVTPFLIFLGIQCFPVVWIHLTSPVKQTSQSRPWLLSPFRDRRSRDRNYFSHTWPGEGV